LSAFTNFFGDLFRTRASRERKRLAEFETPVAMDDQNSGSILDIASARRRGKTDNLPSFLASAIDRPTAKTARSSLLNARLQLRDLFTPAQPVTQRSRFAGRLDVLANLIEIIEEQRSHVVVYGERGIGKTSLMHILADLARESQYLVIYESCGSDSHFDEIFRSALRQIPLLYLSSMSPMAPEAESKANFATHLPDGSFNARELSELLARVTGTRVIIILDEYDRTADEQFRRSVAELIKNLSDRAARVQLVLAGVASNLQELIGYIPSVRRNIVGLPMPRMTGAEVRSLIGVGESGAGIKFEDRVTSMIELLANGSPYLVRLLSHHASMKAVDAGRMNVDIGDIRQALDKAVDEAEMRVDALGPRGLERFIREEKAPFVAAVARAATTPDGWFAESDIVDNLPAAMKNYDVRTEFSALAGIGHVLSVDNSVEPPRYRFIDEALPTYLWLRIARDHLKAGREAGEMASAPLKAAGKI
jgi:Cdc6-like AAA superfamily ATPase